MSNMDELSPALKNFQENTVPAESHQVPPGRPVDEQDAAQAQDGSEVPDGSVEEVLEWAGDDPDRQKAALEAEKAGKNRKGIIDALDS